MMAFLFLLCFPFISPLILISHSGALTLQESQEYFEITPPLPTDHLNPTCRLQVINHSFTNTTSFLFSTSYSPPAGCSSPWTYVVLNVHAVYSNGTSYGISGLWLGGIELLRTSTPKLTTNKSRNLWSIRKDITRYSSLLAQTNLNLTMMLHSVVNNVPTGAFDIVVTMLFYKSNSITTPLNSKDWDLPVLVEEDTRDGSSLVKSSINFYDTPADLIIPISDDGDNGLWFRVNNGLDLPSKQILVPHNTRRAVLELYVSFHGNDESWYRSPPTSYLKMNNISLLGNGVYREVFVTIDGTCVGSELPFPVMLNDEISALFWKPIVGIGAFNLPSYDFEVTPFLDKVLDDKLHEFGIGVGNSLPYWLVDANLHLWLDKDSSNVKAATVVAHNPSLSLQRVEEFKQLDGYFEIKGKGRNEYKGWVISKAGNLTTLVIQQFRLRSSVQFQNNATKKIVKLKIKVHKEVQVLSDRRELLNRIVINRKYPMSVITSALPGRIVANVSHGFEERCLNGNLSSSIYNNQISNGWIPIAEQQPGLPGDATIDQRLRYKDESICYSRTVSVANGVLSSDDLSYGCISRF